MNTEHFQPVSDIRGEDAADTKLLKAMAKSARTYIESSKWCPPVKALSLAYGVGGVVAIFYVEFRTKIEGTDSELWVVVGDLPSAYLVVEANDDPKDALGRYCDLMDDWVACVEKAGNYQDVFPVSVEPTLKNAQALKIRIEFLRRDVIPQMRNA